MSYINGKICNKCNLFFDLENFYKSKTSKDGVMGYCKKCSNLITKKYHTSNKEALNLLKKEKIKINCEFQSSYSCLIEYEINKCEFNRNIKRNNGKYRCIKCAATDTHLNKVKIYNTNFNFFNNIDDELHAYLLGIIAGDGHISQDGYLHVVANTKDNETLELIRNFISPNNVIKNKNNSNCNYINICSKQICRDVCHHLMINPGKKSDKISLPNLNEKLMFHFIRGLMDSDGWVKKITENDKSRRCFYSSTSKTIILQIKSYLEQYGIKSIIENIKLVMNGNNAKLFLSKIYENANFFLKRKNDRFMEWS